MSKKKRGLGKGLDALLTSARAQAVSTEENRDEAPSVPAQQASELQRLPIEWLQPGQYQPRKDMHNEALEELAASIKAQGLMQLIPETAERFNVKKPFDPEQNIRGGLAYLRWLLAYFQGDIALVAAGYNAGEGAVNRYAGVPPYPETRGYVKRIRELFKRDDHPFDPKITTPSPEINKITRNRLM